MLTIPAFGIAGYAIYLIEFQDLVQDWSAAERDGLQILFGLCNLIIPIVIWGTVIYFSGSK